MVTLIGLHPGKAVVCIDSYSAMPVFGILGKSAMDSVGFENIKQNLYLHKAVGPCLLDICL